MSCDIILERQFFLFFFFLLGGSVQKVTFQVAQLGPISLIPQTRSLQPPAPFTGWYNVRRSCKTRKNGICMTD